MEIREYHPNDERSWLRCRVLSFLDTAYFDNVLQTKDTYENPSIELVAVIENQVVGLLDIEYEIQEGTVCSRGTGLGGMIWHIAVHPDFQGRGIGKRLLKDAEQKAIERDLYRLEAWTRDDDWVNKWYEKNGFLKVDSYLHVYLEGKDELNRCIKNEFPDFLPIQAFAHYIGEDKDNMKSKFKRVHECVCYEKYLEVFNE